jgi:hypothetical protein
LRQTIGRWGARCGAAIAAGFAAFQLLLAGGGPYGDIAWGGSSPVLPPGLRAASAGAALYLLIAAAALLARAGDIGRSVPRRLVSIFVAVLAVQFALNTAANLAARSAAEKFGMGAASAVACACCVAALWGGRRA